MLPENDSGDCCIPVFEVFSLETCDYGRVRLPINGKMKLLIVDFSNRLHLSALSVRLGVRLSEDELSIECQRLSASVKREIDRE